MVMLQVNKKLIYIFLIIQLLGCDKKYTNCELQDAIYGRIELKKFEKSSLKTLSINKKKKDHLLKINSNGVYIKISPFIYDELKKGETLFTINDSLNYTISDIKTDSIMRQTMVNESKDCILVSYKVNDSIFYHHQEITINR
jgi:hypothetical protein